MAVITLTHVIVFVLFLMTAVRTLVSNTHVKI